MDDDFWGRQAPPPLPSPALLNALPKAEELFHGQHGAFPSTAASFAQQPGYLKPYLQQPQALSQPHPQPHAGTEGAVGADDRSGAIATSGAAQQQQQRRRRATNGAGGGLKQKRSLRNPAASSSLWSPRSQLNQTTAGHGARRSYTGLNGRSYRLPGHQTKFLLPDAEEVRLRKTDGMTGELDVWPAAASSSKYRIADGGPASDSRAGVKLSGTTAKPKFLQQLESFCAHELALLGCDGPDAGPSASRLQVYREAFQYFMEDFKTYKPLLSRIKNEYEMLLDRYASRLHFIPPLKARLSTLKQETAQLVRRIKQEHREKTLALETKVAQALARATDFEAENAEQREKIENLDRNLQAATTNYADMKSANTTLVAALKRHEDMVHEHELQGDAQQREETVLKQQLDKAMAARDKLAEELSAVREQRQDDQAVAAKEAAEAAEAQAARIETLSKELADVRQSFRSLSEEHSLLIKTMKDMTSRREQMEEERERLDRLRNNATPRPDWEALLREAGIDHEIKYTQQGAPRSTESVIDHLIETITNLRARLARISMAGPGVGSPRSQFTEQAAPTPTPVDDSASPSSSPAGKKDGKRGKGGKAGKNLLPHAAIHDEERQEGALRPPDVGTKQGAFFRGLGTGIDVPRYLRLNGRVRNRRLGKRETERLIKDVWIKKEQARNHDPLSEFFYVYLKKRFRSHALVVEWAYNVVDALERYEYDNDCELFLKILRGQLSDAVQIDQVDMLRNLHEALVAIDRNANGGTQRNVVQRTELLKLLRRMFPTKPQANFNALQKALFFEAPGSMINYVELLAEDRDGNQGKFCEALRDQHLEEVQEYIEELTGTIRKQQRSIAHDASDAKASEGGAGGSAAADGGAAGPSSPKLPKFSDVPPVMKLERFRVAILEVDPSKPLKELYTILARGAGCSSEDLERYLAPGSAEIVNVEDFVGRMQMGLLKRSSPSTSGEKA